MKARVQKWGNSLALRIPKVIALEAGLHVDTPVEVRLDEGKLVIEAIVSPSPTLEGMLAGITDENIHGEIDTGPGVGNEAW